MLLNDTVSKGVPSVNEILVSAETFSLIWGGNNNTIKEKLIKPAINLTILESIMKQLLPRVTNNSISRNNNHFKAFV
jgi:hypothetical protein